ncbi:MAG: hypothetical protein A4E58_00030 [Syntrophorhabdus sp. PtaB.Bin006]|nr:MAG: hypothetical protein A4E58_00030 [Syntrophorhabdus sp. PtaB.Bin006]
MANHVMNEIRTKQSRLKGELIRFRFSCIVIILRASFEKRGLLIL